MEKTLNNYRSAPRITIPVWANELIEALIRSRKTFYQIAYALDKKGGNKYWALKYFREHGLPLPRSQERLINKKFEKKVQDIANLAIPFAVKVLPTPSAVEMTKELMPFLTESELQALFMKEVKEKLSPFGQRYAERLTKV